MDDMVLVKDVNFTIGTFSLRNINLDIKVGEYYVFLGPSGNGKTQLLRVIAGLNSVDSGEVWIDGERRDHLPPEARDIGFVFQDQVLFPHMSVFDNIAFSMKLKKVGDADIKEKVENMAEMLGISYMLERSPVNLSGGEKQRVALARAMISRPKVLIMDEPFAALDRNLAERLTLESKELHEKIKQTTIHVTHNQEEAITLADRILILENGEVRMIGTPDEIFRRPNSCFVADFVCTENIYQGAVVEGPHEEFIKLHYKNKEIFCDYKRTRGKITFAESDERGFFHGRSPDDMEGKVDFCVRPESTLLYTSQPENTGGNVFKGQVVEIYDRGLMFQSVVAIGRDFFVVNLTMRRRFLDMGLSKGSVVYLSIDDRSVHII